jgi:hypothetical protein
MRRAIILVAVVVGACGDTSGLGGGPSATSDVDDMALQTLPASPPVATPTAVSRTGAPVTLETTVTADEVSLAIAGPVRRGEAVVVKARSAKNAECFITVTSPGGPVAGLDVKATDGAGDVTWSWTVAASAAPGQWPIEVTCILSSASGIRATARGVLSVE